MPASPGQDGDAGLVQSQGETGGDFPMAYQPVSRFQKIHLLACVVLPPVSPLPVNNPKSLAPGTPDSTCPDLTSALLPSPRHSLSLAPHPCILHLNQKPAGGGVGSWLYPLMHPTHSVSGHVLSVGPTLSHHWTVPPPPWPRPLVPPSDASTLLMPVTEGCFWWPAQGSLPPLESAWCGPLPATGGRWGEGHQL